MPDINFPALRNELLLGLRGRLSQARFSQILGYRSNRVHRWDSGETAFLWCHFRNACIRLQRPFAQACHDELQFSGSIKSTGALVGHLLGSESQTDSAKRLGISRSMISRWRRGLIEPSLEQMLRIVHGSHCSMTRFLDRIVPAEKLPSITEILRRERRERDLHFKYPWIAALILCLRTIEYNDLGIHQEGYLARKLGIPIETEREVVRELLEIGALEYEGKILCPTRRSLNTTGDPEGGRRIREYWSSRMLEFIRKQPATPPNQTWSYMVFNTCPDTAARIRERYYAFFQDVNSIILSSDGRSDNVAVMSMQLLSLDDLP